MQQLSFKNRIAFNYILYTAILVFIVFFIVHSTVKYIVFNDVSNDIKKEIALHLKEMRFDAPQTNWINKEEWEEKEHNEVNVNPVFIEIRDLNGIIIEKSPNLKKDKLDLDLGNNKTLFYKTTLNNQYIQLSQTPIFYKGTKKGYLLIAMSLEHPIALLETLEEILYILYPIVLISLFFIARIIAGRSIRPINSIIETSNLITKDNLKYRIELPKNKDELYKLSSNINSLLDRIENAVEREKQFTSDASHELRTPLAVLKGTLEVLIRKPRETSEYESKIKYCISEVNRLNILVDELLLLARFENQQQNKKVETIYLNALVLDVLARYSETIASRKIQIKTFFEKDCYVNSDSELVTVILTNLVSNALKYCNDGGVVTTSLSMTDSETLFKISNSGLGIPQDEIDKVFAPFFRSQTTLNSEAKGVGLGLSIVQRLCELLSLKINIESELNKETVVTLTFN